MKRVVRCPIGWLASAGLLAVATPARAHAAGQGPGRDGTRSVAEPGAVDAQTTVTLRDGTVLMPGQTREQGQSEEWVGPFVGLRPGHDLGNGWSVALRTDVGGFGWDMLTHGPVVGAQLGFGF